MAHPDPAAPPDLRPWQVGDELVNPVTGEYARILEMAWQNPEGRVRGELLAKVGWRVVGAHLHPGSTERFTVLEQPLAIAAERPPLRTVTPRERPTRGWGRSSRARLRTVAPRFPAGG